MKLLFISLILIIVLFPGFALNAATDDEIILDDYLNGKNIVRLENYLVYYTYLFTEEAPTNQWGYEISVNKEGFVVGVGTKVKFVSGGFIISGHGTKKEALMNVKVGDIVSVDLNSLEVIITREILESSLFLVNKNYQEALSLLEETKLGFYDFDLENVNRVVDDLRNIKLLLEAYDTPLSSEEEELVTSKANESTRLFEEVIYRTSKTRVLETRALWHRPKATSINEASLPGVKKFVAKVKELGFNTIYVETFLNGFAAYRSNILDTHPLVENSYYGEEYGYDYIACLIGEANKLGISVHAWCHTFNAGSSQHKSDKIKDEWLVEDYQGNTLHPNVYGGSYYLDPSNEEVLEFVESVFLEMAENYNFAGIQLDYIRYYDNNYSLSEIRDSGFGEMAENKFKEAYQLTGDVRNLVLNNNNRKLWNQWRQENINQAVKRFSEALKNKRKDLVISASVVSDISTAKNIYMQDWEEWVKKGYLDLLVPMIYTGSFDAVKTTAENIKNKLGNLAYLNSGIASGYYGYPSLENHYQIQVLALKGGSSIFASQNVIGIEATETLLKLGLYRDSAVSELDDIETIVNVVLDKQIQYIAKYASEFTNYTVINNKLQRILALDKNNPRDYQNLIEELNSYKQEVNKTKNELIKTNIFEDIDQLIETLDIRISRELYSLGYYNPSDENRPNPDNFKYGDEDFSEDDTPKKNNVYFYLGGFLLVIVAMIFTFMKARERENL